MRLLADFGSRQFRSARRRPLYRLSRMILAPCLIVSLLALPAASQSCPGDCSGNRMVTVDELVSCLGIGLQTLPREQCPACDADSDGRVGVEEVVRAVAAALRLLVVEASGTCLRPGATGLVPCAAGTMVQVGRCDDRAACLRNSNAVVSVAAQPVGANGSFSLVMDRCQVTGETLVFEAEVQQETGTKYRTMDFGSITSGFLIGRAQGGGTSIGGVLLGPSSEAAVRVLEENGLENFDDRGAADVFDAAESSNSDTDFSGLEAEAAADFAEQVAANDPVVQSTVNRNRTLCTLPEFVLQLDNGNFLQGVGVNNGQQGSAFIWLNRHIVNSANLPIRITALSNVWPAGPSTLVGGESTQMLVYVDADADGDPSNAELVASQPLLIPTPNDAVRRVHPFDQPAVIDRPGDVYVGFADLESGVDREIRFMALQDDSGGGARSFLIFNSEQPASIDFFNLGNNEFIQKASDVLPGAWFVRAQGACDG